MERGLRTIGSAALMVYASTCLWLIIVVLLADGVYRIWSSILKAKVVDGVLLPGTVIQQIGQVVGLLITGATAAPPIPAKDGGPPTIPAPQPKIPFFGPMIVALVPMIGLAICIYTVASQMGLGIVAKLPKELVERRTPGTLNGVWDQLRGLITLAEATLNALRQSDANGWTIFLFVYLLHSLSVRLAPLPGKVFNHVGAIAAFGAIAALMGSIVPSLPDAIVRSWPVLTLTIGWLTLALLVSLCIKAIVSGWKLAKG